MQRKTLLTVLFLLLCSFSTGTLSACPVKVLAIGNSFSEDALEQYMHSIADATDTELVIGNLYHPGCSVERHFENITLDRGDYNYRKIMPDGRVDTIPQARLAQALADEEWDIITFQQASHFSGMYPTFDDLKPLMAQVRKQVGEKPEFYWHMTWAYSPDSKHDGFKNYGNDQDKMYVAIVRAVEKMLADNPEIKGVIPTGTAVQNARQTALGKDLTRDGYHMSLKEGRFIASATWLKALFGKDVPFYKGHPDWLTPQELEIIVKAVDDAVANPFVVTSPD